MLEELYAEVKSNSELLRCCIVGQWASTLSEADQKALDIAINDDELTTKDLFILLKRAGGTFGRTSVREHRNGECVCRQQMITMKL